MSVPFAYNADDPSVRHVLGLSGGKDSAALAIYIQQRYPDIHAKVEYFFSDTGAELPEVYQFLDKLEAYLGKEIARLNSNKTFESWLEQHKTMLPSPRQSWCTRAMKIKPFEEFVDTVGIPEYYKWRSRSGCYFCFFQRQSEWLGLKRHHPKLFAKAKAFENMERKKYDWKDGVINMPNTGYTWSSQGTLDELVAKAEEAEKKALEKGVITSTTISERWQDVLRAGEDDDPEDQACNICSL